MDSDTIRLMEIVSRWLHAERHLATSTTWEKYRAMDEAEIFLTYLNLKRKSTTQDSHHLSSTPTTQGYTNDERCG